MKLAFFKNSIFLSLAFLFPPAPPPKPGGLIYFFFIFALSWTTFGFCPSVEKNAKMKQAVGGSSYPHTSWGQQQQQQHNIEERRQGPVENFFPYFSHPGGFNMPLPPGPSHNLNPQALFQPSVSSVPSCSPIGHSSLNFCRPPVQQAREASPHPPLTFSRLPFFNTDGHGANLMQQLFLPPPPPPPLPVFVQPSLHHPEVVGQQRPQHTEEAEHQQQPEEAGAPGRLIEAAGSRVNAGEQRCPFCLRLCCRCEKVADYHARHHGGAPVQARLFLQPLLD